MRDVVLVVGTVAMYAWSTGANVMALLSIVRREVVWVRRVWRVVCPTAMAGFVTTEMLSPPRMWLDWMGAILWPLVWVWIHRVYCKDRHGRRLLEAARGWVRRRGNRLVVAPEVAR
jgi:hypothetical protein